MEASYQNVHADFKYPFIIYSSFMHTNIGIVPAQMIYFKALLSFIWISAQLTNSPIVKPCVGIEEFPEGAEGVTWNSLLDFTLPHA